MNVTCNNIKNGKLMKRGFSPISRVLGLIQGAFFPAIEKRAATKVWIDNDCNKCLLCVSICPMHNFEQTNNEIKAKGNCIMCYRCINRCPQKAISVFLHGKVKQQYSAEFTR